MGLDANVRLRLTKEAPDSHLRPSVAHLFQSLAETRGASAVGVLLTGMGKDGAAELGLLKRAGAITIAQDRQSSVVYGMPREAVQLDNVTMILPADRIAAALVGIVSGHYALGAISAPEGL
jgi:two-component system chemotaxis response regulator CheB